jgi:chromosome partitioning protein
MSMTQAIALNETTGGLKQGFEEWYNQSSRAHKTIYHALDQFIHMDGNYGFEPTREMIYSLRNNYHFIPSVQDLYWYEMDGISREKVKFFLNRLLGKIQASDSLPKYKYMLFDCPPSFSILSFSVLSTSDLVLVPVNPDFFSVYGANLLLGSLRTQVQAFPLPKIAFVMNKAKTNSQGELTQETRQFLSQLKRVVDMYRKDAGMKTKVLEIPILERSAMRRAITDGSVPPEMRDSLKSLWKEIVEYSNE